MTGGAVEPHARAVQPAEFFAGSALGLAVYERLRALLAALGPVTVRVTKSQVAFRRRRGFAYLWRPGQYLARPEAEVVLSIALPRCDPSPRFKEVAHPTPRHWVHHLEVHTTEEIDAEVEAWLAEAAAAAD